MAQLDQICCGLASGLFAAKARRSLAVQFVRVTSTTIDPSINLMEVNQNRQHIGIPKRVSSKGRWYYFANRIDALAKKLPWVSSPPRFRLLDMNRQWGSCSPDGEVILNPHLVKAARDGIDYVLTHELAHLRHHDHGPAFWRLIDRHCPGWKDEKRRLDRAVEEMMTV